MSKPVVVVLCGSTRFADAYKTAMREETLAGNIVLTVGLLGHQEGIDMNGPIKKMLDELHLRKIDMADEVLILNVLQPHCPSCGLLCTPTGREGASHCCKVKVKSYPYVGESTSREIAYAKEQGKSIRYLNSVEGN